MALTPTFRPLAGAALIALTCLAFCGCCKKEGSDVQPGAAALPSAARAMAPNAPYVHLEGTQILVDGGAAGSTRAVEEAGRLMMIDELRDVLKAKREAQRTATPSAPFSGKVILVFDGYAPAITFKSVFFTIAHAGYPHIVVRTSESEFVSLEAQMPRVRIFGEDPPEREVHVHVRNTEVTVVIKQGTTVEATSEVHAHQRDALASKIVEEWGRAPLSGSTRELIIHANNTLPFSKIATTIDAAHLARARLPKRSGGRHAFDIVFVPN